MITLAKEIAEKVAQQLGVARVSRRNLVILVRQSFGITLFFVHDGSLASSSRRGAFVEFRGNGTVRVELRVVTRGGTEFRRRTTLELHQPGIQPFVQFFILREIGMHRSGFAERFGSVDGIGLSMLLSGWWIVRKAGAGTVTTETAGR